MQLENVDNEIAMRELFDSDDFSFRFDVGLAQPSASIKFDDIRYILKLFANHYIISSVKAELDQMLDGLNVINILDLVRANPNKMKELFIHSKPPVLSVEEMLKIFPPKYSEKGSNRREAEEDVVMLWIHLLQVIERKPFKKCMCMYLVAYQL